VKSISARLLVWTLPLLYLGAAVPLVVLQLANHRSSPVDNVFGAVTLLIFVVVGVLIAERHPRNPIGWLLCGAALALTAGNLAIEYAVYGLLTQPGSLPGADWAGTFGTWDRSASFFVVLTFLLLLFPTGRLPSPRWRPLVWATLLGLGVQSVNTLFSKTYSEGGDQRLVSLANPLGVIPADAASVLLTLSLLVLVGCVIGCVASVVVRFRLATGVERQQLKWLTAGVLWAAFIFALAVSGAFLNVAILMSPALFNVCFAGIALAVGIAILRHRLFDIDFIINRALVYGALTTLLLAIYAACILGAQAVLGVLARDAGAGSHQPVITVGTTLLVVALFRPLRARVQRVVDQRFYRQKYDAQKTLAAFAATLRTETELGPLSEHLVGVVDETMRPAYVSLWLRRPGARGADQ
jgi:hypothetical protein